MRTSPFHTDCLCNLALLADYSAHIVFRNMRVINNSAVILSFGGDGNRVGILNEPLSYADK